MTDMMWSLTQRQRLARERDILEKYFPSLVWYNPTLPDKTYVEGLITTNGGGFYWLRIYVPASFPAECPDMVVTYPHPLCDRSGHPLNEPSAAMHVLGTKDEFTKICHYRSSRWIPDNTLYKVALKGRIWLEAYDAHLRTAHPLDRYLRHQAEHVFEPLNRIASLSAEETAFLALLRNLRSQR